MPGKHQNNRNDKSINSDKKAAVLGAAKKKNRLFVLATAVALALVAALSGAYLFNQPSTVAPSAKQAGAGGKDSVIAFDAAMFADGKARHFAFAGPGGVNVRFFVLKSSDGVIRAAFDACDVCWRANRGYSQDGDYMVCNNCGRRFASIKVNEVKGGCNPAPLNRTLKAGKVIIAKADVISGRRFFDFGSKGGN